MISKEAEEAYCQFLEALDRDPRASFTEVLARHPSLAAELRELHACRLELHREHYLLPLSVPEGHQATQGPARLANFLERLTPGSDFARRYRILRSVGRGGMGRVLLAFDRRLRRVVAMKFLAEKEAGRRDSLQFDPVRAARLLEEAQVTAQLDHPGIPPVHEVGLTPEGELYYTMKFVASERTLEHGIAALHANDPEWTLPRVLGLVQRAAEAVAYAHERGLIHRDLKPANILVDELGAVYVTDWGVAAELPRRRPRVASTTRSVRSMRAAHKRADGDTPLATRAGFTVGTAGYMSPEQAAGRVDELDERSDVYSMGALLHRVLLGELPPEQGAAGLSGVAPELRAITEKALAHDPAQRYADLGEFARDLAAFQEQRVVRAYETGAWSELRKWMLRNRRVSAALALAVVAASAGLVASLRLRDERRAKEAERARVEVRLAAEALQQGNIQARQHLESVPPALRGFEWRHLMARLNAERVTIPSGGTRVVAVGLELQDSTAIRVLENGAWERWGLSEGALRDSVHESGSRRTLAACLSPTEETLIVWDRDGLTLWDRTVGESIERFAWPLPAGLGAPVMSFDPTGEILALSGPDRRMRLWSPGAGFLQEWETQRPETALAWIDAHHLVSGGPAGRLSRWSTAGTLELQSQVQGRIRDTEIRAIAVGGARIATGDADGAVRLWNADTLELTRAWIGHDAATVAVAFEPSGERLATGSVDRSVRLWSFDGTQLASWAGHEAEILFVGFDARGENVLSAALDGSLRSWRAEEAGVTRLATSSPLRSVAFAPDSRRLACGSSDSSVRLFDADAGHGLATLRGHGDRVGALAWTADGRVLSGSADRSLRLWNVETLQCVHTYAGHAEEVLDVAQDPRGGRFASAGGDGRLLLWDLESSGPPLELIRDAEPLDCLAWSRDGKALAAAGRGGRLVLWDGERTVSEPLLGRAHSLTFTAEDELGIGLGDHLVLRPFARAAAGSTFPWSGSIDGLACLPDGSRLIAISSDRRLRLWDRRAEVEVLSLRRSGELRAISVAPDGSRVAVVDQEGSLDVFETRPPRELEAIRAPLRLLEGRVAQHVVGLFERHLLVAEVLAAIDADERWSHEERHELRRLAQLRADDPVTLGSSARDLLVAPGSAQDCRMALQRAEAAVRLQPKGLTWQILVGAAHARLGAPEEALRWLPEHGKLKGEIPQIQFLALGCRAKCLVELGRLEEARACRAALRLLYSSQVQWRTVERMIALNKEIEAWTATLGE